MREGITKKGPKVKARDNFQSNHIIKISVRIIFFFAVIQYSGKQTLQALFFDKIWMIIICTKNVLWRRPCKVGICIIFKWTSCIFLWFTQFCICKAKKKWQCNRHQQLKTIRKLIFSFQCPINCLPLCGFFARELIRRLEVTFLIRNKIILKKFRDKTSSRKKNWEGSTVAWETWAECLRSFRDFLYFSFSYEPEKCFTRDE